MLLLNAYHCHDHAYLPRFSVRCILVVDIDDEEPGAICLVAFLDMGMCMSTLFLDHDALDEIIDDTTGNAGRHAEDNRVNKGLVKVVLARRWYQTSLGQVLGCCFLIPGGHEIGWPQV